MPVIPINSDYSNISAFVNSLFDADVRKPDVIKTVVKEGRFTGSFSSQNDKILAVWKAAWQAAQGDQHDAADLKHCPASDANLLKFLGDYIAGNPTGMLERRGLSLFMPQLRYLDQFSHGRAIYELDGYQRHDFQQDGKGWNYDLVDKFLHLLISAAHFVVIHAARNLPPGVSVAPLYKVFRDDDDLASSERRDPGNSHYASIMNRCGEYYPKIEKGTAPDPSPFILSLLVCPTVSRLCCRPRTYNTFFQLEGWEAIILHLERHTEDLIIDAAETYWTISTYGFSVYTERRATTIFLAPPSWNPQTSPKTIMAPYVGAETRQRWLATDLVRLPG